MYYLISSLMLAITVGLVLVDLQSIPSSQQTVHFIALPVLVWGSVAGFFFYWKNSSKGDGNSNN